MTVATKAAKRNSATLHATSSARGASNRRLRVLFVCPRFAPSNAADSHRVRLLLPHLAYEGVDAEVLAVDPRDAGTPVDQWLEAQLPADVPVHQVRAWRPHGWGTRGLAQRAFVTLYNEGCRLLAERRFDLVFFSTTEFLLHLLGPVWQTRYGVPFFLDLQDPWVNDYYRNHPEVVPPGGRFKYGIVQTLHRAAERRVVPHAAGILAVSERYVRDLHTRYGSRAASMQSLVEAFPAEPAEFDGIVPSPSDVGANGSSFVWRYVGRGGADMHTAMSVFFEGWRTALGRSGLARTMRLETIGTTYAQPGHGGFLPSFVPVAQGFDLADRVTERPGRIGYRETLAALASADGLVVFGSDDPTYTASKLYPYLAARRPLVVICHRDSPMVRVMRATEGGICIPFDPADTTEALDTVSALLAEGPCLVPLREKGLAPYTAREQAHRLGEWLKMHVVGAAAPERVAST
ncbi:MAG: hypothetical protein JST65_18785 [Acidobacteria bacterium]|nr:hypothetical protein [Acidobacteriota bacterium]